MKSTKLATGFVALSVALTIGWNYFHTGKRASVPPAKQIELSFEPDTQTRRRVEGISAKDVVALHFFGIHFGCFEDDPIEVTDSKLISLFLEALHQANGRTIGNRVDTLQIHLKSPGKQDEMIVLTFSPLRPEDSFGLKFRQALHLLARYRAEQVREYVRRNSSHIEEIKIYSLFSESRPHTINNAQKIKVLTKALLEVNERAFDFTNEGYGVSLAPAVTIKLRRGEEKAFVMRLGPQGKGQQDKKPPLPALLWEYVNRR